MERSGYRGEWGSSASSNYGVVWSKSCQSEVDDYSHEKRKKSYRSRSRSTRSRSRSHSRDKKRHKRTRQYRGSSGTRTRRRTQDRDIRLKEYYINRGYRDADSNRYHEVIRQRRHRDSYEYSRSRKRSHNNNHKGHNSRRNSSCSNSDDESRHSDSHHSKESRHGNTVRDDEDGHLIFKEGDMLRNRYEIMGLLGEGTFGKCLECYDRKRGKTVALKVIRNIEKYREAAKLEIKVLEKIGNKDPEGHSLCIELLGAFNYHGHACLVFPKLGKSIFDFMKENNYQPYPISQVQFMAYQLMKSVKFIHDMKLSHTDLKPENLLFVDSSYDSYWSENARQYIHKLRSAEMRLIDFGSATFDNEHHSTVVSTRHYRAPEVVLELGWSKPCDIWSCGCIIYELYTGNTLFQTHDNREHMAMMEYTLGPIPSRMIKKSKKTKYFRNNKLDWPTGSSQDRYVRDNCQPLSGYRKSDTPSHFDLFDLLDKMLQYEPDDRITAKESLKHHFFDSIADPRAKDTTSYQTESRRS